MSKIRLPNKEKYAFFNNLATMLSAGIPILESIDSLMEESSGNSKKILEQVKTDISNGKTMSDSLSKQDKSFDKVSINLLKSAEESGNLDSTLKEIANYIKKNMEFTSKIKSAMLYPMLVFLLFIGIMIVILSYVIPKISEVFSKLNVTLPTPTKIIILISDFHNTYTIAIYSTLAALAVLFLILYRWKRNEILNVVFALPLISKLVKKIDMARFTGNFGLLLKSGIPITKALEYSPDVVILKNVKEAIDKSAFLVSGGKTLSDGFSKSPKIFSKSTIRITQAGEKSGNLENTMLQLGEQFENQVDEALKTLVTVLEPALLIIIGLFVGGIMLSIIAPIYQLIGNITPSQ